MKLRNQPPHECDYKGCTNKPTKKISLSLAAHANHEPAISTPLVYFCDGHAKTYTFDDFIAGDNWDKICDNFLSIGRMAPKKEFSKIIIEPI